MVIYIGNLQTETSEQQIREVFQHYGQVSDIRIMVDPVSHRGLGFGFVSMPDEGQAHKAIRHLHHTRLRERVVIVCAAPQRNEQRSLAHVEGIKVG
jgi:RNA recognition motif-containing protein